MNPYHKIKDFHAARARGIGSSDIATLAGMTMHYAPKEYTFLDGHVERLRQTPYALYLEKEGLATREEAGERADWGHRLEGIVLAKWVEDHYGVEAAAEYLAAKIRDRSCGPFQTNTEAIMPGRPYVIAHADLVVDMPPQVEGGILYRVDDSGPWLLAVDGVEEIVEAKTSGLYAAKRRAVRLMTKAETWAESMTASWGDLYLGYDQDDRTMQGIPDPVYLQVQWQMLGYGAKRARVVVLIDTGDYREYGPIPAAPRVQEKCLALAERFQALRESKTPPKPEAWSDVTSLWPTSAPYTATVTGDDEMRARDCVARYWSLGARMKEIEDEREELKDAVGIYMGENQYLVASDGTKLASSWEQPNPRSCDLKRMEKEDAKLYARLVKGGYITQTTRREMRPAKIKEE